MRVWLLCLRLVLLCALVAQAASFRTVNSARSRPDRLGVTDTCTSTRYRASPATVVMSAGQQAETMPPILCGRPPLEKRAIVFDIDGTLCDSSRMAMAATNKVLEEFGFAPVSAEQYHYNTRYTTPERLARHAGLSPDDGTEFHEQGTVLGAKFDETYIALVDKETAGFYPGIRELLDAAPPNVKLGALTNAAVAYAEAVLSVNGVRDRFSVVHGADDVLRPKPYPDGLLQTLAELGVTTSEAVYVGDAPSDAQAAAAAGVTSLGVAYGSHGRAVLAGCFDTLVGTVQDAREALLGSSEDPVEGSGAGLHVLVDRDGVLNSDVGRPGVVEVAQVQALPGAGVALRRLKRAGARVSIITNQKSVMSRDRTHQGAWQRFRYANHLLATGRSDGAS